MILRSSMVSDIKACPAKAFYKYELGLQPIQKGNPSKNHLSFGRIVHEAIEKFHLGSLDAAIKLIDESNLFETRRKNKQTAKALIKTYSMRINFEMEIMEKEFSYGIGDHVWQGRYDGIGFYNGHRWVIEHKTTNPFYLQFKPNDQFIAYWIGANKDYGEVKGVLLNSLDCDKLEVETIPITFSKDEQDEWLDEICRVANMYENFKHEGVFPRNPGACKLFNSLCPFYALCSEPEGTRENVVRHCYTEDEKLKTLSW